MTLAKVRELCVDKFPKSDSRLRIMEGLESLVARLEDAGLSGELWLDGSFVTHKYSPNDADVVFRPRIEFAAEATGEQKQLLQQLNDCTAAKLIDQCHTQIWYEYPEGHPKHDSTNFMRAYWRNQFGLSRTKRDKGIVVLLVGGGL